MCDKSMLSIDDAPAAAMQCPIAHSLFDAAIAVSMADQVTDLWSLVVVDSQSFLPMLSLSPSIDADCWSN